MIDPKMFTVERLVDAMLDDMHGNCDAWRILAEIVPEYMPPFPRPETRPICVVRIGNSFLRGGGRDFFWDMYGDNFRSPEQALLALVRAPIPPHLTSPETWAAIRVAKDERQARWDAEGRP
jgi:hypothetical protein